MSTKANPGRDAFAFSLRGMTTIASFVNAPVIADDTLSKFWDARLSQPREDRPRLTRRIEDLLARYFATGCCQAA